MVNWVSLLPLLGAACGAAQATPNDNILAGVYIVEFEGEQSTEALYRELRTDNDLDIEPRMALNYKLFNGASFNVSGAIDKDEALARIASNSRVKNVWPVTRVSVPNDRLVSVGQSDISKVSRSSISRRDVSNATYDVHVMTQVDRLHAEGYTGKGIKIGIVDSGIDYLHPDLGGCFGPGCLVSYGYDLMGGGGIGQPRPDDDPIDTCFGHGTHVAGIVAAQQSYLGFLGVAPDVELGAFRALDCIGGSSDDLLIAAFNMAYEAGSDIISASVGMDGGWPDSAWSLAAQRIVDAGVSVVVATGNSGEIGIFSASNPAVGLGVTSVASVDAREFPFLLLAGTYAIEEQEEEEFGWIAGQPPFQNLTLPLFYVGSELVINGTVFDGCNGLPDSIPDLSDYVVLVEEQPQSCNFYDQTDSIVAKGARYALFFRESEEPEYINTYDPSILGVGRTTGSQGKSWAKDLIAGRNVTVTFTNPEITKQLVTLRNNTVSPGSVSFWSSWGPDWELGMNPFLAAPGSQILSTFPRALGSYAILEGTSMACPFVAGAMALVAQARGTRDPETLRAALTTTAKQIVYHDGEANDDQGRLAPVAQAGSGLIQAWDAAHVKSVISTAGISFRDTDNLPSEIKFTLKNLGDSEVTYELGNNPTMGVYAFAQGSKRITAFPPLKADGAEAKLEFSNDLITVGAGESVEVAVVCTPPSVDASRLPVYGGLITVNGTNGDTLALPYLGVAASMKNDTRFFHTADPLGVYLSQNGQRWPIPVEPDTIFRGPRPSSETAYPEPGTIAWPQARVVTNVGSKLVRLDVVAADNSTARCLPWQDWLGYRSLGQLPYFPLRDLTRGSFRGTLAGMLADHTILPNGRYRFVLSALKLLGEEENPEDWESVEMIPFIIEYTTAL
ncbi:minor extracellular protease vpr [Stachybotrys elegans]|uniref:Minor extracellular protease vpr n=1 Tax=Stachybotrys elegans TaxID=80388 RepID=A0A8K0SM49_9HYPO|nr:minor extracellular protease vpr [Stachybotrys elegans]